MESFKLPQAYVEPQLLNCGNCVHANEEIMPGQLMKQLVCHRFPPQVVLIPAPQPKNVSRIQTSGQGGGVQMMAQSMFPPVAPSMYCHSHTLRPENPDHAVAIAEPGQVG